jgi:Methyltransferase domain
MIFTDSQQKIADELLTPRMGTDIMAPLIHFLTRFTRPQNVLEGGAGYTTAFLAKALADNKRDFDEDFELLRKKTEPYLADVESIVQSDPASMVVHRDEKFAPIGLRDLYGEKASVLARRRFEWLLEKPSWVRPSYYLRPYHPKLFCIDKLSSPYSSASRVPKVIERLELSDYVKFENVDFWSFKPHSIPVAQLPIDLIWIDLPVGVREMNSLLVGDYWKCLNPDGGLLIIHDMMTTRGGQLLVNEFKRRQKESRFKDFELIGLLEPQRLMQGDFIMLRKTSGNPLEPVDDVIQFAGADILENEAQAIINRAPKTAE